LNPWRSVEVAGRTVAVRVVGEAPASTGGPPPTLLLHGAGGAARNFGSLLRRLGLPAAAVDLPGHGRSGGAPLETVDEAGAFALRVARAVWPDGPPVVLAGHSLGGAQALEAAVACPERVRALVLIATGARLELAARHAALARRDFALFLDTLRREGTPEVTVRQVQDAGAIAVAADLTAAERFAPLERAPGWSGPSLLIAGGRDAVAPPSSVRELADALGGAARVEVFPDCGHLPMVERPDAVAEAIARFVRSLA
jgi:pimeloyl-ACP methyl ester carboxylesterase